MAPTAADTTTAVIGHACLKSCRVTDALRLAASVSRAERFPPPSRKDNVRSTTIAAQILRQDKARTFRESGVTKQRNEHFAVTPRNAVLAERMPASVQWTVSNKPARIDKGSAYSEFAYGPNRSRYRHIKRDANGNRETLHSLGLIERSEQHLNGGATTVQYRQHIKGGSNGTLAILTTHQATGAETLNYLLKDHQGSVIGIVDANGNHTQKMAFDAWGKRISATTLSHNPAGQFHYKVLDQLWQLPTTRGYTGHEMLDHLGLIHMNGRIYDPEIGRFLSADPFVQFPHSTQGYNCYSYVGNNPLSYTDPSGFFLKKFFGKVMGLVGVALNFVPGCQFWCQVGFSALTGAVNGYMATGSFSGALRGAVGSAAFTALGHNFSGAGQGAGAASDWGFHEVMNVATQVVGVFDQKAAMKMALINGSVYHGMKSGVKGTAKFLADQHIKNEYVRPEMRRFARKNGLSLTELNVVLAGVSFGGNALVGSRYENKIGHIEGWNNRGPGGLLFDAVDTVLAYQGLPTASSVEYMLDEKAQSRITGHSLGAIDANNLVSQGFAESASLMALPFGNSGMLTQGSKTELVPWDFVSGFPAGWILNPMASPAPNATFDHSCEGFTDCPNPN